MERIAETNSSPHSRQQARARSAARWPLIAGGAGLALYGLSRRSAKGAALAAAGGLLAFSNAQRSSSSDYSAVASFTINCTPETAYSFWHDFEKLPSFMRHLESVSITAPGRSRWTALGPMDTRIRWDAEITDDRKNERIAWQSLPGSDLRTTGSVEFRPGPAGRGTMIEARISFRPPAASMSRTLATVFGKNPEFMIREDIRRFKSLLETGEIPTTHSQPHGPRGVHGRAEQVLFREKKGAANAQPDRIARRSA